MGVIDSLANCAKRHRALATLGFTHFQPAQLTTVGKRACLWCYDFVLDLIEIEHRLSELRYRGAKGTTGTQASFLALFHGDHDKVRRLDRLVSGKMGVAEIFPVTGQTYTRQLDSQGVDGLSGMGQAAPTAGPPPRPRPHRRRGGAAP